jgi:hypothetical protein
MRPENLEDSSPQTTTTTFSCLSVVSLAAADATIHPMAPGACISFGPPPTRSWTPDFSQCFWRWLLLSVKGRNIPARELVNENALRWALARCFHLGMFCTGVPFHACGSTRCAALCGDAGTSSVQWTLSTLNRDHVRMSTAMTLLRSLQA